MAGEAKVIPLLRPTMVQREAARRLGELVGRGEMSLSGAQHLVPLLPVPEGQAMAMAVRLELCWLLGDVARSTARARTAADVAVRWAVRPLFRARAPAAEIEDAAGRAAGEVLGWDEIVPILREERLAAAGRRA